MKCEVLVDWLTFSVKVSNPDDVIRDWLGMDSDLFESFPYGFNGYLLSKRFSSIVVCYNGYDNDFFSRADMGVCVSMSGDGCRAFDRFSTLGFGGLFRKLAEGMEEGERPLCHVSRVDVACDERFGALDMNVMVEKAVFHHEFNSRMRAARLVLEKDGDEYNGRTVYVGSSSSAFRIRIYDKALEQREKGNWKANAKGHWIRVEMVMKDENACGFIQKVVEVGSVGKLAGQVLNDKFRFIERDDVNISRCSVCDWWAAFVEEVESVVIWSRTAIQHPLSRIENWLTAQVATSLYMISQTMGFSRLYRIAMSAEDRLSRRQEALIHDFKAGREAVLSV